MLLVVLFAVQAIFAMLRAWLFTVAGERIVADLRTRLFSAILDQDVEFFDQRRTGELTNRLAADTTVLQNTVTVNVSMALRHLLGAVGGIALLAWMSPRMTAVAMAIVPIGVVIALTYGKKFRKLATKVQDALAAATAVADEVISGIRTVRSFAREEQEVGALPPGDQRELPPGGQAGDHDRRLQRHRRLHRLRRDRAGGLVRRQAGVERRAHHGRAHRVPALHRHRRGVAGLARQPVERLHEARPAPRSASSSCSISRGNLELSSGEPAGDVHGALRFDDVTFAYPTRPEQPVLQRLRPRGRARQGGRAGRPLGRRQVDRRRR